MQRLLQIGLFLSMSTFQSDVLTLFFADLLARLLQPLPHLLTMLLLLVLALLSLQMLLRWTPKRRVLMLNAFCSVILRSSRFCIIGGESRLWAGGEFTIREIPIKFPGVME